MRCWSRLCGSKEIYVKLRGKDQPDWLPWIGKCKYHWEKRKEHFPTEKYEIVFVSDEDEEA